MYILWRLFVAIRRTYRTLSISDHIFSVQLQHHVSRPPLHDLIEVNFTLQKTDHSLELGHNTPTSAWQDSTKQITIAILTCRFVAMNGYDRRLLYVDRSSERFLLQPEIACDSG